MTAGKHGIRNPVDSTATGPGNQKRARAVSILPVTTYVCKDGCAGAAAGFSTESAGLAHNWSELAAAWVRRAESATRGANGHSAQSAPSRSKGCTPRGEPERSERLAESAKVSKFKAASGREFAAPHALIANDKGRCAQSDARTSNDARTSHHGRGRRTLVRVRFFFVVLFGNVVFRNFVGSHFALIGVRRVFHAANRFGFEILSFFFQFGHGF